MFTKKSFIKLFSVGMILLQCNTSIVVKKPQLSNFLEIREETHQWQELLNLPNAKNILPAQATSISNTKSSGKAIAVDNSVAQIINAVKSNQAAEANAKEGSAAVAVSSGNTDTDTKVQAEKNSNALGVGATVTDGKATADAERGSLAVAANLNNNENKSNLCAADNSNVASVSSTGSVADAAVTASNKSIADGKSLNNVKSDVNVNAKDKSDAAANTSNGSISTTNSNAVDKSIAQALSTTNSDAKTNLEAIEGSKALGNLEVKSGADAVGNAAKGGNALSTGQSNAAGDIQACGANGSTAVINNRIEDNAKAVSNSEGTLPGAEGLRVGAVAPEAREEERTVLRATPQDVINQGACIGEAPVLKTAERKQTVLRGEAQEQRNLCDDIKNEGETLRAGGADEEVGKKMEESQCDVREEASSGEMEDRIDTTLQQDRGVDRNECDLRAGTEREVDEYAPKIATRRSNRLRSRRDDRKNRRKALRQQRRRKVFDEEVCDSTPILRGAAERETVEMKTIPKIDLGASADNFIINNARGIQHQSANNLARVQDLLNKATC